MADWLERRLSYEDKLPSLSHAELLVLMTMERFAYKDGEAWPSRKTVADKAKVSEKTVTRAFKKLLDVGILRVVEVSRRNRPTHYAFVVPSRADWGDKGGQHDDPVTPLNCTEVLSGTPERVPEKPQRGSKESFAKDLRGSGHRYRAETVIELAKMVGDLGPIKNLSYCRSACKRFLSRGGTFQGFCQLLAASGAPRKDGRQRSAEDQIGLLLHWMYARDAWEEVLAGDYSEARSKKFSDRCAPELAAWRGTRPGVKSIGDVLSSLGLGRMLA